MAELSFGPNFIRETNSRDGSGLHAAVALVTYSKEARVSSEISLFSFRPLSLFFPSLLHRLFSSSISSFHSLPSLEHKKKNLTTGMLLMSPLPWRRKPHSNRAARRGRGQRER